MKERGGIAATLALLIATIFGVSYIPRKAAESSGGQSVSSSAARVPASSSGSKAEGLAKPRASVSCEQISKRLRRFYPEQVRLSLPPSCYPDDSATKAALTTTADSGLRFAIAIVPNPVQTHLPLVFDRAGKQVKRLVGFTAERDLLSAVKQAL